MKQLMIARGVAAIAAGVQAASFSWSTANYTFMADNSGKAITTAAGYESLMNGGSIVLVLLNDGTYSGSKTVLEGTGGNTAGFRTSGAGSVKYGLTSTFTFEYDSNILANGDKIGVMYKDSSGALSQLFYVDSEGNDLGKVDNIYTVADLTGDDSALDAFKFTSAGTSASKNYITAAVPEPTSGLLLLLGMAGLALKRKRA